MDQEENLIVLNHEAFWLLNGMDAPPGKHPELFPFSSDPPASIFLTPGKGRKRSISNQPGGNANYYADGRKTYNPSFRLGKETSALANIPADRDSFHAAPWFRRLLIDGVQSLTLNSQKIRQPSPPGLGKRFQPDGSNLPWVVAEIRSDRERFKQWLAHINTALPDIEDVELPGSSIPSAKGAIAAMVSARVMLLRAIHLTPRRRGA